MAKSVRSKIKKRIRAARANHYWEVKGKARLNKIVEKLNDPNHDPKDHSIPLNAFMHPNNPNAVFPQWARPDIIDFRSNKIEGGNQAVKGTFRKHLSKNAKKSKYAAIIKTREELDAEEAAA